MTRARYDDAFGVCPIEWKLGAPNGVEQRPVLVEVWRAVTAIGVSEATKPRIRIEARVEMRVWADGGWKCLGWGGKLRDAEPGEVRRYAYPGGRTWYTTITLDGWS